MYAELYRSCAHRVEVSRRVCQIVSRPLNSQDESAHVMCPCATEHRCLRL